VALLLDTNVVIWWRTNDKQLSTRVRERLLGGADALHISAVSAWEYGQKRRKYPALLPLSFTEVVEGMPFEPLALAFGVHRFAESLPLLHNDPFDRMLIAQALHHGFTLVASDENIHRYPVPVFW
jgi:PIN domain nuclease of toxin-antitoxin system